VCLFDVSECDCAGDQVGRNGSDDAQWVVTTRQDVMLDVIMKGRKVALNGHYQQCKVKSILFILVRHSSTDYGKHTGCFRKSFTTLKAYRNLYRGHTQRYELSKCSKTL
jgi:hypothetical protein